MPREIDNEDLCVWADGTYCRVEEFEDFIQEVGISDDVYIVPFDSKEASLITGDESYLV